MRFFQISSAIIQIYRILRPDREGNVDYKQAGVKINRILSSLGPTFIKLGQMLSLRADIIPADLADELRQLLDHGPMASQAEIEKVFKAEIGQPPSAVFQRFEPKPFAVASISQVHRAYHQDRMVAVKIQRPGVKEMIHSDLGVCRNFIRLLSLFSFIPSVKKATQLLDNVIQEFFKWIDHELDYRLEALNMARIKHNFEGNKFFVAPEVIHAYSTRKVLTMEFVEGISLNVIFDQVVDLPHAETIKIKNISFKKRVFLDRFIGIVFKQIFMDGYFHADPHPANILLTSRGEIAFIDFGVIGVLQPHLKETLVEIVTGVSEHDVKKISEALIKLDEVEGNDPLPEIEQKVRRLMDNWQTGSVLEMTMAEVFYRLLVLAQESGIDMPISVFVLGKTILEYDGLLRKFDPDMDIFETLRSQVAASQLGSWQKFVPVQMQELLQHMPALPPEVVELAGKLYHDGVEFATHLLSPKDKK